MGFLNDSAVLIAVERERISVDKITTDLAEYPLAISVITASELLHGMHRAKEVPTRQKRAAFVNYLLELFPVIPVDLEVTRIHAVLWVGPRVGWADRRTRPVDRSHGTFLGLWR